MTFKTRLAADINAVKLADNDTVTVIEIAPNARTTVEVSEFDSIPRVTISAVNSYYSAKELRRIAKVFNALADAIESN